VTAHFLRDGMLERMYSISAGSAGPSEARMQPWTSSGSDSSCSWNDARRVKWPKRTSAQADGIQDGDGQNFHRNGGSGARLGVRFETLQAAQLCIDEKSFAARMASDLQSFREASGETIQVPLDLWFGSDKTLRYLSEELLSSVKWWRVGLLMQVPESPP
jgi:hypothetical protein